MSVLYTLFRVLFTERSYGQQLEDYITSHNPTTTYEVEALEREWQLRQLRNSGAFLLG